MIEVIQISLGLHYLFCGEYLYLRFIMKTYLHIYFVSLLFIRRIDQLAIVLSEWKNIVDRI